MKYLILLVLSILPIYLLGLYLYKKDKEKEPIKLLVKLFFGGFISCIMVLIISVGLNFLPIFSEDIKDLNLFELIISVFVGVAFVEELCKWIIVYTFSYHHDEFDEFYDMIIYAAFVSLGFACFENVLYVFQGGISTAIIRAVLAVPGHVCDAIFMGYYLGLSKLADIVGNKGVKRKNILLSILVPMILHGIYDYCLMSNNYLFLLIFLVFIILMYVFSIKKIRHVSSLESKIIYKNKYCPECGTSIKEKYCPECGMKVN